MFEAINQTNKDIVSVELDNNYNQTYYSDKSSNLTLEIKEMTVRDCSLSALQFFYIPNL